MGKKSAETRELLASLHSKVDALAVDMKAVLKRLEDVSKAESKTAPPVPDVEARPKKKQEVKKDISQIIKRRPISDLWGGKAPQ